MMAKARRAISSHLNYLEMVDPSVVILPLIAVPSAVKAPTTAIATKAAATAYSDNSRPVSSRKNFLIICVCSFKFRFVAVLDRFFPLERRFVDVCPPVKLMTEGPLLNVAPRGCCARWIDH